MPTPGPVEAGLRELRRHQPHYDRAAAYYEGTTKEVFASSKLRHLLGNTGDRFRVNFARTPVDAVLERVEIAGISCPDTAAQATLEAVWEENELGLEAKDIHRMTFEFGDAYIIALPDASYETGVSAYAHDPRSVRVFYDPSHPRRKSHAIQRWQEFGSSENGLLNGRLYLRVNMYYINRVEQYVSSTPIDDGTGAVSHDAEELAELVQYDDDIPLTFGKFPVFHFRTGRPYGRPVHRDAYGPQDMLNKTVITMMASIDYAGFPQRYVLTDDALTASDAFSDAPPSVAGDDDSALHPHLAGRDARGFDASPGATWLLSGTKSVGQFAAANSDNFLKPIDSIVRQMAVVTDTPFHLFDLGGQTPSGESRRAAEAPLLKHVDDLEAHLGVEWSGFFDYCLAVSGSAPVDAEVVWKPAASMDDLDSWKTAEIQKTVGLPLSQIAIERGYDPDLVALWQAEADRRAQAMAQLAAANPGNNGQQPSAQGPNTQTTGADTATGAPATGAAQ